MQTRAQPTPRANPLVAPSFPSTAGTTTMHDPRPTRPCLPLWLIALLAAPGCATLGDRGETLVPTRYQTRTGPYSVYTNFPIEPGAPAIRSLEALQADIEA